jgi:hypothetical protein
MGFYNLLFGENSHADLLRKILDIDQPEGKWHSGRYRDCYLQDGKIVLYTRNGGGNREDYFPNEIRNHPNYVCDYDDDFDCTYAYIEFSIPKEYVEDIKHIDEEQYTPTEKFQILLKSLKEEKQ